MNYTHIKHYWLVLPWYRAEIGDYIHLQYIAESQYEDPCTKNIQGVNNFCKWFEHVIHIQQGLQKTKQIMPCPATQPKLTVVEITIVKTYSVYNQEANTWIELTNIGR